VQCTATNDVKANHQISGITGLPWTEVGGELLTVEGVMMPGKAR
jgi:ATP-dependent Lon protease